MLFEAGGICLLVPRKIMINQNLKIWYWLEPLKYNFVPVYQSL